MRTITFVLAFALLKSLAAVYVEAQKDLHAFTPQQPSNSVSFRVIECEAEKCDPLAPGAATWSFEGREGKGNYTTGVQPITIEHLDRDTLMVRRKDTHGPAMGLEAVYLGVITGNRIVGSVTYWSGPQHLPTTNAWYGAIVQAGGDFPQVVVSAQVSAANLFKRIVECEGAGCSSDAIYPAVWIFSGKNGTGQFTTGDQPLRLLHSDGDLIVVDRTDDSGPAVGLNARYIGKVVGKEITGSVTYRQNGKVGTGPWYGVIEDPRALMPKMASVAKSASSSLRYLVDCEGYEGCYGKWTFDGSSGKAFWSKGAGTDATLKIEEFSPDRVSIIANSVTVPGLVGTYEGRLEDRTRIRGSVTWKNSNNGSSSSARWSAIIPATTCKRSDGLILDAQEALDVGRSAHLFGLLSEAKDCYLLAAKSGNAVAQHQYATLLYEDTKPPSRRDYPSILSWTTKSAEQGYYFAQLDLVHLYNEGLGTAPNAEQAAYWKAQAASNPTAPKKIQANGNGQDQAMSALLLLFLGAMVDSDSSYSADREEHRGDYTHCRINGGNAGQCAYLQR